MAAVSSTAPLLTLEEKHDAEDSQDVWPESDRNKEKIVFRDQVHFLPGRLVDHDARLAEQESTYCWL
jgi:hypothetical protein